LIINKTFSSAVAELLNSIHSKTIAQGHKLYFKKIELKNIKQKAPIIKSAYLKVLACAETLILKQVFIDEEVQFALPS
jgi:uncharacterized protein (UPF0216 family)